VGKVKVLVDGANVAAYDLYPATDVPAGGFFRRLIDSMRLWFA
jgi:hypothetical protein